MIGEEKFIEPYNIAGLPLHISIIVALFRVKVFDIMQLAVTMRTHIVNVRLICLAGL